MSGTSYIDAIGSTVDHAVARRRSALEDGSLVRLGSAHIAAQGRYHVVVPMRRKPHPLRDVVVEWLADRVSR